MSYAIPVVNYIKPFNDFIHIILRPLKYVCSFIMQGKIKSANRVVAEQLHAVEYREYPFSVVLEAVTRRDLGLLKS